MSSATREFGADAVSCKSSSGKDLRKAILGCLGPTKAFAERFSQMNADLQSSQSYSRMPRSDEGLCQAGLEAATASGKRVLCFRRPSPWLKLFPLGSVSCWGF